MREVDARIDGVISGTGGITLIAQDSRPDMETNFVMTGANTFTGPLEIRRGSVYLLNSQAINGNDVTFNAVTGQNARLFAYGNSINIGTLKNTGAGTALIANANINNPVAAVPAATININQSVDTIFSGNNCQ